MPTSPLDPRDSHVLHREFDRRYPMMTAGQGSWVMDVSGNRYLDAVGGGAAVTIIGHGDQRVLRAAEAQLGTLAFAHNQKYTNPQQERLAERLSNHAPDGMTRVFFVQGGAEANEAALRIIRKFHVDKGEPDRDVLITQSAAYHGSTLGTLSLSGRSALKHPFEPWLPVHLHFPPFHSYRSPYETVDGTVDWQAVLDELADQVGHDRIAAVLFEPVPASAAPALVPPPEFMSAVRSWCDRHGALLVLDEVVTGVGRTGRWFGAEHWDLVPDVITAAKGLGAGYTPIGALIVHQRVYDVLASGSREFEHGHTLNGNPASCAIANAVLDVIEQDGLVERSADVGRRIKQELIERLADVEMVGEVRGIGTLLGVEYVQDRTTKAFLDPELNVARRIELEAFQQGLLVYGTQNTHEGYVGDATLVTPPYNINDSEAGQVVDRLVSAISSVAADVWQGSLTGAPLSGGQEPPIAAAGERGGRV